MFSDREEVEQLEVRILEVDHHITQEEFSAALASSSLNGFNIIKQENHSKPDQPCFIVEKRVKFGKVKDEGPSLMEIFPTACTRQRLWQLTRGCQDKALDEQNCVFGVEISSLGKSNAYQVCPILRIDIEGTDE